MKRKSPNLNEKNQRFSAMDTTAINFAKLVEQYIDINESSRTKSLNFTKDDIRRWIENPDKNEDKLIEVSRYLYTFSSPYKRLIDYFSQLPLWTYVVEPYGIDVDKLDSQKEKIMKNYNKALRMLSNMNIRHEMAKIAKTCFREDVFYGYEHEIGDSYYIQKLNPKYCKIIAIEDGCYSFAFDFSYFDSRKKVIRLYPNEFREKYVAYTKDKKNLRWQKLDTYQTICIKANEDLEFVMPPFASTFESVYDIDVAKKLRDTKDELGNYKILVQKLPIRKDSELNNDFAIDYDTMMLFHNQISQVVPEQVGVITTPMEVDEFKFDNEKMDIDKVSKTETGFWNTSGVPQTLFGADKMTSGALDKSVKTDEMIAFAFLRQVERWINRKLKNRAKNMKITLLDITHYNKDDVFDKALMGGQYGMPLRNVIASTLGLNPSSLLTMAWLENEVLNLDEKLVPLISSHTQSANDASDKGGRPEKEGSDLTESAEKSKEREANEFKK
ncbi:hypothetical protein [Bacillus cereus]|uniref:SPP1 family phage portal protein n=1 Tax=Bacillus cereus HuA3-9 TaxID=1053205 RepID=R8CIK7_BACCE|nr:hypothetical protein [Bacillus cereus]EOO11466.1 hypothetical protein IGA_05742 [Bacillus cereus HuA3-9]